jgi:ankyrin repeat protein
MAGSLKSSAAALRQFCQDDLRFDSKIVDSSVATLEESLLGQPSNSSEDPCTLPVIKPAPKTPKEFKYCKPHSPPHNLSPITPMQHHTHPLVQFSKIGINEKVKELLDDRSLQKSCDDLGWALMCAVQFGRVEVTKSLILAGAPLTTKLQFEDGRKYHTILMACKYGHHKCLELIMNLGRVDANAMDEEKVTGLMLACKHGHLECAQLLLDRGANIEAGDRFGVRPLHYASRGGKIDVVRALLHRGCDTNACDDSGTTALMWVAQYRDDADIAMLLIEYDAQIEREDFMGLSALAYASKYDNQKVLDACRDMLGQKRTSQKLADEKNKCGALQQKLDVASMLAEKTEKEVRALKREKKTLNTNIRHLTEERDSLRARLRECAIIMKSAGLNSPAIADLNI